MNECACPAPTPILDELAGETVCAGCARVLDSSMERPGMDQDQNHGMFGSRVSSTSIVGDQRMRRASRMANRVDQKRATVGHLAKSCCAKLDIGLINSRPYHPQTNGKLERFHRTIEDEVGRHDSLEDFITFYNERRLHWSLDIDNCQTPLKAFHDKAADESTRATNPNWMEADVHG